MFDFSLKRPVPVDAYQLPLAGGDVPESFFHWFAAVGFAGQLSVFDSRRDDAPCYNCLFPEGDDVDELRCAVTGVFAPLTGIIGALQAAEALKLLTASGDPAVGRLLLFDALTLDWRSVRFARDPLCAVCAGSALRPGER